jgi:DNA-directed RNA polymerase specialized sigma24 family protein
MRRDEHVDFFLVRDDHLAIHRRLEEWARWVRVRPHGWQVAPMFRQFRSNWRQWHEPVVHAQTNVPDALEIERIISVLPEKHRTALRWSYCFPGNPAAMARKLAVNLQGLRELVEQGRSMVRNRIN